MTSRYRDSKGRLRCGECGRYAAPRKACKVCKTLQERRLERERHEAEAQQHDNIEARLRAQMTRLRRLSTYRRMNNELRQPRVVWALKGE